MLLPALKRARGSARKIECQNRFKNIGSAFFMYSGDWSGYLPALCPENTRYGWWINIGKYLNYKDWEVGSYPVTCWDETFFWCPSVSKAHDPTGDGPQNASIFPGIRGYAMGRFLTASTSESYLDIYEMYQSLTRTRNPSAKILGGDSYSFDFGGYWDYDNNPELYNQKRHINGKNILYADGHVDFLTHIQISKKVVERTLF
jgi:prepilin-type processing-associated H-X9-DG protein